MLAVAVALALLILWPRALTLPRGCRRFHRAARLARLDLRGNTGGNRHFQHLQLLASPRDLITTDYGRLLLFKFGLVAAMVIVATVNRYSLTPRLPAPDAQTAVRRNSLVAASLCLGVLPLVGALGAMPSIAHQHDASAGAPSDAAFVHIHDVGIMAVVTIVPVGSARLAQSFAYHVRRVMISRQRMYASRLFHQTVPPSRSVSPPSASLTTAGKCHA